MAGRPFSFSTAMPKRREESHRYAVPDRQRGPSFSASLLEKIYDSIDEGDGPVERARKTDEPTTLYEAMTPAGTWRKSMERSASQRRTSPLTRASSRRREFDHDVSCFSAGSCSSESSSGPFSSSESDSVAWRPRMKPVKTKGPPEISKEKQDALFRERNILKAGEESSGGSVRRSKQWKLFEQLKPLDQPTSPGGRLVSFIHSLFSSSANKERRGRKKAGDVLSRDSKTKHEKDITHFPESTCCASSARTSRSKQFISNTNQEVTQSNVRRRTVRFGPVSVIVDDGKEYRDNPRRGCEGESSGLMPMSVPTAWTIGRVQSGRDHSDHSSRRQRPESNHRDNLVKPRRCCSSVEESNQQIQPGSALRQYAGDDGGGDEGDDAFSCSSSDLFDLPLYETTGTGVDQNRPIHGHVIGTPTTT